MLNYFTFISIFQLLLTYLIIKKVKKLNIKIFLDNDFSKPQSFHHKSTVRLGGFIIFFSLLFFFYVKNFTYKNILLVSFFFFIGAFSDCFTKQNPFFKFILMLGGCFAIVFFLNLEIPNTQISILNKVLKRDTLIMTTFIVICFLFVVNGANFIDGFNGLLLIHYILILCLFAYINSKNPESSGLFDLCFFLILSATLLLWFNFPKAKVFLGDNGSYLIGSIISLIAIDTSIYNPNIPPFLIACIVFYLFFEVFFSFFRKIFSNLNPFYPDNKHMHMLIFRLINKKFDKYKSNYLVTIFFNTFYIFTILPIFFSLNDNFYIIYFFFLPCIYILTYFILYKKVFIN